MRTIKELLSVAKWGLVCMAACFLINEGDEVEG